MKPFFCSLIFYSIFCFQSVIHFGISLPICNSLWHVLWLMKTDLQSSFVVLYGTDFTLDLLKLILCIVSRLRFYWVWCWWVWGVVVRLSRWLLGWIKKIVCLLLLWFIIVRLITFNPKVIFIKELDIKYLTEKLL